MGEQLWPEHERITKTGHNFFFFFSAIVLQCGLPNIQPKYLTNIIA